MTHSYAAQLSNGPGGEKSGEVWLGDREVKWFGYPGMRWAQLIPEIKKLIRNHPPPDLVVIHIGATTWQQWAEKICWRPSPETTSQ